MRRVMPRSSEVGRRLRHSALWRGRRRVGVSVDAWITFGGEHRGQWRELLLVLLLVLLLRRRESVEVWVGGLLKMRRKLLLLGDLRRLSVGGGREMIVGRGRIQGWRERQVKSLVGGGGTDWRRDRRLGCKTVSAGREVATIVGVLP